MPNDETEDLAILRMTIKRLECLENQRKTPDTNSRKTDVSQLQNQILANIKTVEKHFKHYLDVSLHSSYLSVKVVLHSVLNGLNHKHSAIK